MRRVLVMSSERSGSNLLRSMLDAHPALWGPPPAHFTNAFTPHLHLYGDLTDDNAFRRLAEDVCALPRIAAEPWSIQPTVTQVLAESSERSLWGLVDGVFSVAAEAAGAGGWVCKDNNLFRHAFAMHQAMGELHILYLVRDGRDYATSVLRAPLGPKHEFPIARQWRREQIAAMRVHQQLGPVGACHRVRYEDLVADPEAELRRVCTFLKFDFDPAMLTFHQRKEARKTAELSSYWSNLAKPVMQGNTNKYLRELTRAQILCIEGVAGPELAALGYTLEGPPVAVSAPSWLRRTAWKLVSRWRERQAVRGAEEQIDRQSKQRALREMRARAVDGALRGR